MDMELWMWIDAGVCLIVIGAALMGAVKGIGDTIVRILWIAGGIGLGVMFRQKLADFLMQTKLSHTLNTRIFGMLRGEDAMETIGKPAVNEGGQSFVDGIFSPNQSDNPLSKSLGNIFDSAADKAAEAAAERLTQIAMGIIAFALIILAVSIVALIIKFIIRQGRKTSVVIGFADRVLGLVLGGVRGLLLAWIAIALLIPLTTLISPANVPAMLEALPKTTVAKVIYDVNPFLYLIRHLFL